MAYRVTNRTARCDCAGCTHKPTVVTWDTHQLHDVWPGLSIAFLSDSENLLARQYKYERTHVTYSRCSTSFRHLYLFSRSQVSVRLAVGCRSLNHALLISSIASISSCNDAKNLHAIHCTIAFDWQFTQPWRLLMIIMKCVLGAALPQRMMDMIPMTKTLYHIHHNYDVNTRALVQHFMTNATQQEVLKLQETVRGPVKIPAPTTPTLHNF